MDQVIKRATADLWLNPSDQKLLSKFPVLCEARGLEGSTPHEEGAYSCGWKNRAHTIVSQ